MKFKPHKLILITSSLIIVFAVYLSQKQIQGFQASSIRFSTIATDGTPSENLLNTINNVINTPCVESSTTFCPILPSWITPERKTAFINLNDLAKSKLPTTIDTTNDVKIIRENAYTMSKALNDDDGATFDKIISNLTTYLNNYVPGRPNYYILMQYGNANSKPSWLTPAMTTSYNSAIELLNANNIKSDDPKLVQSLQLIYLTSLNANETYDITFNKIVSGTTAYISSVNGTVAKSQSATKVSEATKVPENTESTTSSISKNLPIIIGITVGSVIIIYFWIRLLS